MDYTQSNGFVEDAGTGFNRHEDNAAVPTAVTEKDMNSLLWSLMDLVKAGGQVGIQFDETNPATYKLLTKALRAAYGGNVTTLNFAVSPLVLTKDHAGLILVDATAGNVSATLPAANVLAQPVKLRFVRVDATSNTATMTCAGADTFVGGALSFTLTGQGDHRSIESDTASKWSTIGAAQSVFPPQRRQAVSSAAVDANGYPVFLTTAASLNLPILATTVPLRLTAANGFDSSGQVNRPGSAVADAVLALANNSSLFIYADVAANGALTYGSTTLQPVVQRAGVPSVTAGQFTFNWGEMKGYVGNGATAAQTYRVFLGEAVTAGGVITSVVNYALNRTYQSVNTAIPGLSTATNFNTNLGFSSGVEVRTDLVNAVSDGGYAVDDVVQNITSQYSTGTYLIGIPPTSISGRNTARFLNSGNGIQIPLAGGGTLGNATSIAGTPTSWRLRVSAAPIW
jgi:hypothetical protein